jgi:hypothetical protein
MHLPGSCSDFFLGGVRLHGGVEALSMSNHCQWLQPNHHCNRNAIPTRRAGDRKKGDRKNQKKNLFSLRYFMIDQSGLSSLLCLLAVQSIDDKIEKGQSVYG